MKRNSRVVALIAVAVLAARSGRGSAPQPSCAEHHAAEADGHRAAVEERGDHVMGFDHERTTHHFLLEDSGGAIEIRANAADDTGSIEAIRSHLPHIARMFSAGDFEAPMLIHGRVPPGVPVLKRLRGSVAWTYEPIEGGGRIRIRTADREALAAVHDFLKFQIEDHGTGDPTAPPAAGAHPHPKT